MYFKKHITKDRIIIAICDENIIGKKFVDGEYILEVSERFYKGERKSEEELKKILESYENVNLAGKKTIEFALKLKVINEESVIKIKGIPHAQIIQI